MPLLHVVFVKRWPLIVSLSRLYLCTRRGFLIAKRAACFKSTETSSSSGSSKTIDRVLDRNLLCNRRASQDEPFLVLRPNQFLRISLFALPLPTAGDHQEVQGRWEPSRGRPTIAEWRTFAFRRWEKEVVPEVRTTVVDSQALRHPRGATGGSNQRQSGHHLSDTGERTKCAPWFR